jgi:hypothetical protein
MPPAFIDTAYGAFRVGSVPLPVLGAPCPACRAPKLRPRPGYGGLVDGCLGCGRTFTSRGVEIDGVEGPRAWVERGEVVGPWRAVAESERKVA